MSLAPYTVVSTETAPSAIGPYSQAVKYNGLVYTSGAIPLDPKTMTVVGEKIEEQTEQALKNLGEVLKASGSGPEKVLKTTVFLASMDDFVPFNGLYEKFFAPNKPSRSCVAVKTLPKNVLVEIECVAVAE